MNFTFEILTSNNVDGSKSYCAVAELEDDVSNIEGCLESKWYDSRIRAEGMLNYMKDELT